MSSTESTTWWAVISSDDLLSYLKQAHAGDDPSMVLASLYLDSDERCNVRPTEEDEDFAQEREARSQVELDNAELRTVLAQGVKLLRTVYGSKEGFAHHAQMWVLGAEAVL